MKMAERQGSLVLPFPHISNLMCSRGIEKLFRAIKWSRLEFKKNIYVSGISRRSDFEVLLFNVIDWLGGKLPWDKNPQPKPSQIQEMKESAFCDIKAFLKRCFKSQNYPGKIHWILHLNNIKLLNWELKILHWGTRLVKNRAKKYCVMLKGLGE